VRLSRLKEQFYQIKLFLMAAIMQVLYVSTEEVAREMIVMLTQEEVMAAQPILVVAKIANVISIFNLIKLTG